jgi:uncharacterized protein
VQRVIQQSRLETIRTARPTRRRLAALGLASLGLAIPTLRHGVAAQDAVRAPWQTQVAPLETTTITVGDQPLTVELAISPASRSRGLGYRQGLAPGTGMLFVFPESAGRSFWMKGMRFCLDIIWIDQGEITGAAESVCPDPPGTADADRASFRSGSPVECVLEVPAGWLEEHGFGPGTPVDIPEWVFDEV